MRDAESEKSAGEVCFTRGISLGGIFSPSARCWASFTMLNNDRKLFMYFIFSESQDFNNYRLKPTEKKKLLYRLE